MGGLSVGGAFQAEGSAKALRPEGAGGKREADGQRVAEMSLVAQGQELGLCSKQEGGL